MIRTWLMSAVFLLLFSGILWSFQRLSESQKAAEDADQNYRRVVELGKQIEQLRLLDDRAQFQSDRPVDSSRLWLDLLRKAEVPENQVLQIERQPSLAIQNSSYTKEDLIIRLSDVSASQVFRFAIDVESSQTGYLVTSLQWRTRARNSTVQETTSKELWNVDVTLTRLIFTAKRNSPGK